MLPDLKRGVPVYKLSGTKCQLTLSAIQTAPEFQLQSDYNVFMMYAEESADGSGADILAIWQLNFYGRTIVVYGHASADDYQRMLYGDLEMNRFGISFNPMSPSRYEKYVGSAIFRKRWKPEAQSTKAVCNPS